MDEAAAAARRHAGQWLAWTPVAGFALLTAGLQALCGDRPASFALLANDFSRTAAGEWHRLLTAGFVHLGWSHLLVDLVCIGIAADLARALGRRFLLAVPLGIMLGQGSALIASRLVADPPALHCGSSDIIFLLLARFALVGIRHRAGSLLFLLALAAYLGCDLWLGHVPFWPELPTFSYSHFGGMAGGVVWGLMERRRDGGSSHAA